MRGPDGYNSGSRGSTELKDVVKQWVAGTPLEGLARAAYRALRGSPPAARPVPTDLNTLYDLQTETIMERVLDRRSTCIDIGCHEGAILDAMLRIAPDGIHYAFEPLPHLYAALAAKYASASNVRLFEVALSEAPGKATFQHVVTNPAYSGILRRQYARHDEEIVEIPVTLARLDDLVPPDAPVRLVKIDVEGAELQVLRGAEATLRRCRPYVVFEHGRGAADCYGTTPGQVFDLLAGCGLRVSIMGDWLDAGETRTLTREAFCDQFETGRNYYFLAHP
jgi:FkbM family methyltransferase